MDNFEWIASQIEDYHNSLEKWTPLEALQERERIETQLEHIRHSLENLEALQERERIETHLEHIRLPEYRKRELYRMLGGAKDE